MCQIGVEEGFVCKCQGRVCVFRSCVRGSVSSKIELVIFFISGDSLCTEAGLSEG